MCESTADVPDGMTSLSVGGTGALRIKRGKAKKYDVPKTTSFCRTTHERKIRTELACFNDGVAFGRTPRALQLQAAVGCG